MNIHTATSPCFPHWESSLIMAEILKQLLPFFHLPTPHRCNDGEPVADKKNVLHLGSPCREQIGEKQIKSLHSSMGGKKLPIICLLYFRCITMRVMLNLENSSCCREGLLSLLLLPVLFICSFAILRCERPLAL